MPAGPLAHDRRREVVDEEYFDLRADGSRLFVRASTAPIFDDAGAIVGGPEAAVRRLASMRRGNAPRGVRIDCGASRTLNGVMASISTGDAGAGRPNTVARRTRDLADSMLWPFPARALGGTLVA